MDLNDIKKQLKDRDRVIRVMSKDGFFRAVAIKNSKMALDAQMRHSLDPLPAFFLAKTLSAASLISAFLKGEERVSVDVDGDKFIRKIFAESIQVGESRGFIHINEDFQGRELARIEDAIGFGKLKVSKVLYNKTEPVTGITELVSGDIATDLAYYFSQSEQIPSAVLLDVSIGDSGKITHSGGLIVQAMPNAPEKRLKEISERLFNLPPLTSFFEQSLTMEEVMKQAVNFDFEVVKHSPVDFFCRCSKESFINRLITLGSGEIEDMRNQHQNELTCIYCNQKYIIENEDFDRILTEIQAHKN